MQISRLRQVFAGQANFKFQISNVKLILVLIVVLFLITRLYQLTTTPPSLYWDEASIGYNAYAVSIDGRDEWGDLFPVHFRAFGEFKLPVYIYSTAVLVKLFGLSEWAVRIPAVVYSMLTIILVYLIGKKISGEEEVGLLSAFLLTICPWFFIFSRTGYEATAGLTFFCLGVLAFLYVDQKRWLILVSAVSFILSMYSYNSYRVSAPLAFGMLCFLFFRKKEFKRTIIYYFLAFVLFFISMIPIVKLFVYDSGLGRVESFALIPNVRQVLDAQGKPHLQIIYDRNKKTDPLGTLRSLSLNYLSHFSFDFLFVTGDKNPRSHQPGFGQFYIIDGLFLAIGLFLIFRNPRKISKLFLLPVILVLIAIIPPSLLKESPHALRALTAVPFLCLIMAIGIGFFIKKLKNFWLIIPIIYLIFFGFFNWNFFQNYNLVYANEWQYGYKIIFAQFSDQFKNYDHIYVSDDYAQPYIYALYYQKIKPEEFRKSVQFNAPSNWGFSTVASFERLKFGVKNLDNLAKGKTLIFVSVNEKISAGNLIGHVKNINGQDLFNVYEYNSI